MIRKMTYITTDLKVLIQMVLAFTKGMSVYGIRRHMEQDNELKIRCDGGLCLEARKVDKHYYMDVESDKPIGLYKLLEGTSRLMFKVKRSDMPVKLTTMNNQVLTSMSIQGALAVLAVSFLERDKPQGLAMGLIDMITEEIVI